MTTRSISSRSPRKIFTAAETSRCYYSSTGRTSGSCSRSRTIWGGGITTDSRYRARATVTATGGGTRRDACRGALRRQDPEAVAPLRPAGLMLFTFPSVEGHRPMRVRVLENDVSEMSDVQGRYGGSWFDYGRVPYPKMWRDDELWLPRLLEAKDSSFFEGRFVFDGPPGPSSRVVDYKVEFR